MSCSSRAKDGRAAKGKTTHQTMPSLAEQFFELEQLREKVRQAELRNESEKDRRRRRNLLD